MLKGFVKGKKPVINGGFVIGSERKMLSLLNILCDTLNSRREHMEKWGFDQTTLNYIKNTGKLDNLSPVLSTSTHRIRFNYFSIYHFDKEKGTIAMNSDGCPQSSDTN